MKKNKQIPPSLLEYLEKSNTDKVPEVSIDQIIDAFSDYWYDKAEPSRDIVMSGGKGAVILQMKWIKEEFGGKWTDKDQKEVEDSLKHGIYTIKSTGNTYEGFYAHEDGADGWYVAKWGKGNYHKYYVKDGWASAANITDITEKEYREYRNNQEEE